MSFVVAAPAALVAAATDIAGIGSSVSAANAAAQLPTSGVLAAAEDQVSAEIAALFSAHGQAYQQFSAQVAELHQQFVQTLTASASSFAAAEASAVQTLLSAVGAPAQAVAHTVQAVGHTALGGAAALNPGAMLSNAVGRVESLIGSAGTGVFGGTNPLGSVFADSALLLRPTGGALGPAAALAPAATGPLANGIENLYNTIEPWVQYGFNLLAYAVGWVPFIGLLGPQINFLYYLFEPIFRAALFNSVDWLSGSISFVEGLSNFWSSTTASINQFIYNEINWVRGLFPPLPPVPLPPL